MGVRDEERVQSRPRLQARLDVPWSWADVPARSRVFLQLSFQRSRQQILDAIYHSDHPRRGAPVSPAQEEVLQLLGNDHERMFSTRREFAEMMPVSRIDAPDFAPLVQQALVVNNHHVWSRTAEDDIRGIGLRAINASGVLEIRMPARAVLLLLPPLEGQRDDSGIEAHEVTSHENAACFRRVDSSGAACDMLTSLGPPQIDVSSRSAIAVQHVVRELDDRQMLFTTTRYGDPVQIILRGNLTYRVHLHNTNFVLAALESEHRAMQIRWEPGSTATATCFERSLMWMGKYFVHVPWNSRQLFAEAEAAIFGPAGGSLTHVLDYATLAPERLPCMELGDSSCALYVMPGDIEFTDDGMVYYRRHAPLVMRRDHKSARTLVLFLTTGTVWDSYPVGRLVPITESTMRRRGTEEPYRYERYTEHQPNEYAVLFANASTVRERTRVLNAYFSYPSLSFLAFESGGAVAALEAPPPLLNSGPLVPTTDSNDAGPSSAPQLVATDDLRMSGGHGTATTVRRGRARPRRNTVTGRMQHPRKARATPAPPPPLDTCSVEHEAVAPSHHDDGNLALALRAAVDEIASRPIEITDFLSADDPEFSTLMSTAITSSPLSHVPPPSDRPVAASVEEVDMPSAGKRPRESDETDNRMPLPKRARQLTLLEASSNGMATHVPEKRAPIDYLGPDLAPDIIQSLMRKAFPPSTAADAPDGVSLMLAPMPATSLQPIITDEIAFDNFDDDVYARQLSDLPSQANDPLAFTFSADDFPLLFEAQH